VDALILSNALDTNGQNARYVRASERWGNDPDVVRALALGNYDPAQVVGRFQAAAEKFGNLAIRSAHRSTHIYQAMPADIIWTASSESMVRKLAMEADILHLNNSWRPLQRLRLKRETAPMLLHHHGSLFRSDPRGMLDWAHRNRAVQAVSTIDLQHAAPDVLHWLPTAYDIAALEAFGQKHRREPDGRVRVVTCPTNREIKSTARLEATVARLQAEGLDIDLVVVEGLPWKEAMKIKATADIYFDQVLLGVGCNAIEAWAMDIPVIAGAGPWTLGQMERTWGTIPFRQATEETIGDAIVDLALHPRKRASWAKKGKAHVLRFHDERPALERLAELYGRAIARLVETPDYPESVAVTFVADIPSLRLGNQRLDFASGPVVVANPFTANRLRHYALRHPSDGIREVA
jgi:hypothetical protein